MIGYLDVAALSAQNRLYRAFKQDVEVLKLKLTRKLQMLCWK